jgi:hypothetical protein
MKFIKQYWLVLSLFLLAVILVLIRTFSQNNFRYDAVKWAEPSVIGSNILTEDQIATLSGEILLISLGNDAAIDRQFQENTMNINPESILEKTNLNRIRKNSGPVILYSGDNSVSARVWMVLSEMGMKNIYILLAAPAD